VRAVEFIACKGIPVEYEEDWRYLLRQRWRREAQLRNEHRDGCDDYEEKTNGPMDL